MKFPIFLYLFWVILATIIIMSIIPYSSLSQINTKSFNFRIDYILHALAYFTLTSFYILWKKDKLKSGKYFPIIIYLLLSIILAIGSEFAQKFIPGRTFNWVDIFYNVLGIIVGLLMLFPVLKKKS